jgi:hypothetical protein
VADWITSLGFLKDFSTMGWVPRYNMNYYAVGNEIDVKPISAYDSSPVGLLDGGYGVIQGPVPGFLTAENFDQHWSMDLTFFTLRSPDACYRLPWLNSGCDSLVQRRIGTGFDLEGAHISRGGIVTHQAGTNGRVQISPITFVDAVNAFLLGKNIDYLKTSTPGLALERIIEMFKGLRDCDLFQNVVIRELLDDLASGSSRLASEVRATIYKSLKGFQRYGQPVSGEKLALEVDVLVQPEMEKQRFPLV